LAGFGSALASAATSREGRVYTLVIITPSSLSPEPERQLLGSLRARGFREGHNLIVSRLFAGGSAEKLSSMITEAVRSRPDVILAISGRSVLELKNATSDTPIVGITSDPLAYGFVASISHPGGNITGSAADAGQEIWGKRLEILKALAPGCRRVFQVAPAAAWDSAVGAAIRGGAAQNELVLVGPPVPSPYDDEALVIAFDGAIKNGAEAAVVNTAPENVSRRQTIARLGVEKHLPMIHPSRLFAEAGGLAAYDFDLRHIFDHAGSQVADILDGTPAGSIPIYQPSQFRLVLNLRTAHQMGLTIPPTLLARADEVIE
jgi:putative ABC transport system substrate-binding protein